jgi:hypothetical protein
MGLHGLLQGQLSLFTFYTIQMFWAYIANEKQGHPKQLWYVRTQTQTNLKRQYTQHTGKEDRKKLTKTESNDQEKC